MPGDEGTGVSFAGRASAILLGVAVGSAAAVGASGADGVAAIGRRFSRCSRRLGRFCRPSCCRGVRPLASHVGGRSRRRAGLGGAGYDQAWDEHGEDSELFHCGPTLSSSRP